MESPATTMGFWGPRTASVDWCEGNYLYSHYVAEWWNTVTSIPIVLAGLWGVYFGYKYGYRARFIVPAAIMIVVGMGSISFHGTLQYWGQALDELSMVYCVSCLFFLSIENKPRTTLIYPWLPAVLIAYNVAFTAVYVLLPAYFTFFVISFIAAVCLVVFNSVAMYKRTKDARLRRMFWTGVAIYIIAFFLLWIPDNLACAQVGFLHLHAWFHLAGAISPWWFINWCIYSYYIADFANKTGLLIDPKTGGTSPAPQDILDHARSGSGSSNNSSNSDNDSMSSGTRGGSPVNSSVGGGATSGAGAISGSNSTNGSSSSSSAAAVADVEDTILIIPEMRWIGPKNLIMWPYVHLSRKASWK